MSASTDIVFPLPLSPAIPKTSPGSTRVVDPVDHGRRARRASAGGPQAVDLEQRGHIRSRDSRAVRGSKTSRRLSPMKLNASTAVKIARPGNVPIHQNWKYWVPVATIEPHSAVGRLGAEAEERQPREEQDRVADVEGGEHEHRADDVRQHLAHERATSRRAEQPRRPDVLRVADREDEAAHDARVGGPGDDHEREDGVREPAAERGGHDHREDDRREREDEICRAHDRAVDPAAEVAGDGAEDAADRRGEHDEEEPER